MKRWKRVARWSNFIGVRLSDPQAEALRTFAAKTHKPMTDVIREALDAFLTQEQKLRV